MPDKIKLGISSCLLGEKVRYNGGHKVDRFLVDILGNYVEYVPVCPEAEIGLGIPREPMRLVLAPGGDHQAPRFMTQKTGIDHTEPLKNWSAGKLDELGNSDVCGYIFKSKSPSCGIEKIKLYENNRMVSKNSTGVFADAYMKRFPLIPVEEEGRLNDISLRENFIVRVFTIDRWRRTVRRQPEQKQIGALVEFHTLNKYLYMAHHPRIAKTLGQLTAAARQMDREDLLTDYETTMMKCLKYQATARKHANVLYHIMGYFKKNLEPDEKQELVETIEHFRQDYLPLIAPMTLIKHYVRKYREAYLTKQYYLSPHPVELKLRNHA